MQKFKVSLMRYGHAAIWAESPEMAAQLAQNLEDEEIHWIRGNQSQEAGELAADKYLIVMIESIGEESE